MSRRAEIGGDDAAGSGHVEAAKVDVVGLGKRGTFIVCDVVVPVGV